MNRDGQAVRQFRSGSERQGGQSDAATHASLEAASAQRSWLGRACPMDSAGTCLAGFDTMGASIPPRCIARCAHWIVSWFDGRSANTNDSEATRCVPGTGSTRFVPGSRPCSRTGASRQRLDDRSRMNREVHVRFWEGLGVRFPRATRLHPEASQKDAVRGAAAAPWRGVPPVGAAEGESDRGRALDGRSRAHDDVDSAEVCGVAGGGVHQGQECDPSGAGVRESGSATSSGSISGPADTSCRRWVGMRQ